MAYKSKFKGKEIDDKLDLVQELSKDISDIKEDIKNTIQEETDPIFSNSPAADITDQDKIAWNNKQDNIKDLEGIRDGASKGATAVQPASLANYVSKDDVDAELSETSTNPVQNQAVRTALEGMSYVFGQFLNEKQGTISDLETIRDGAAKGATAVQFSDVDSEVSETSTNPVQNKVVAGAFNEIVGLLDATISSVDGRFDSKQDNLVSGENIKTINGESILGSGNISIEGVDSVYIADFTLRDMIATADTTIDFASLRSAMMEGKVILVSSGLDSYIVATTRYIPGVGRNPNKIYISVTDGISIYTSTAISNPASIKSSENFKSTIATTDYVDNKGSGGSSEYESNIEDKTLAMPNAVGGIAKGTTISALEGKTYNEMFDDLLFPTVNPTFTAPTASIAFKSYSSTQKVGANGPTSSNFTTGYNAGEIKLNGVKQANRGGTLDTSKSFIYVNGSTSNKTLPSKVTLGKTTFKYRAAYNQGPQPKNNKGGNYSTSLAAGTVDSSAITLNGTYPWYASTSSATSTNPVIEQSLVAWNTTAGNMSTGQFTVQPSGTLPQVFKLPRKLHTLQLKNALNGQMETVSDVSKDYTESTETINIGGTDVTYYVYTYSGSTRGSVTLLAKF